MLSELEQRIYSSDNRGKLLRAGTAAIMLGVAGTLFSVKELVYDLPVQETQISAEITTRYNAPSESSVNEAKEQLMSDRCDDRPCTDQERSTASVIVHRDQLIKNAIAASTSYVTKEKRTGHVVVALGLLSIGVGAAAVAYARRVRT